jgi:hypothetical protein
MCTKVDVLVKFVRSQAASVEGTETELVINGDLVGSGNDRPILPKTPFALGVAST